MRHWLVDRASEWLSHDIIDRGRLPLLVFFCGLILGFVGIRISVRLIRANVRWWFGNLTAGQTHIHHAVFGVILVVLAGLGLIALALSDDQFVMSLLAGVFGVGTALVLDEFALIFYLRDVYWSEQGRTSVDAVFVAIAVTGLILLGFRPFDIYVDVLDGLPPPAGVLIPLTAAVLNLALTAIVVLKGKVWTGLIGIFLWPLLLIGVVRLARPTSPWARWRYNRRNASAGTDTGAPTAGTPAVVAPPTGKMRRSMERERRIRRPLVRAVVFVQDLIAGRPDVLPHVKAATEDRLDAVVRPAPPPPAISPHRGLSGTIVGLPVDAPHAGRRGTPPDSEHEPVEPHM